MQWLTASKVISCLVKRQYVKKEDTAAQLWLRLSLKSCDWRSNPPCHLKVGAEPRCATTKFPVYNPAYTFSAKTIPSGVILGGQAAVTLLN